MSEHQLLAAKAKIAALEVEAVMMVTENTFCTMQGDLPAFTPSDFSAVAGELRTLHDSLRVGSAAGISNGEISCSSATLVDVSVIPYGWYLEILRDCREHLRVNDRTVTQHSHWSASLQHALGGRLTTAEGATPQEALDFAVAKIPDILAASSPLPEWWPL